MVTIIFINVIGASFNKCYVIYYTERLADEGNYTNISNFLKDLEKLNMNILV